MTAIVGLFGLLIGSFLNVVVYRVPRGLSIVSPPSACGSCGHAVRGYDNVPLISWLVLRGRCRDCGSRISVRYPLVELAGAAFFVVVALRFVPGIRTDSAQAIVASLLALVAFLYLAAISIALAIIDLERHRLPNVIVLPGYVVGAVLLGAASALTGEWDALVVAAIGAAGLGVLYLVLALAYPGGMGMGDVKLAGVLGLFLGWLGWPQLVVGALAAFIVGGIFGIVVMLVRRGGRKTAIAFGPWMLVGAWVGVLAGEPIARGYLSLFGLA